MANASPVRLGQAANAGDAKALFLKIFAGEVLVAFDTLNKFMNRFMLRTITSGKSAQFPTVGNFTAAYHVPGTELIGETNNLNERIITIDDLLLAHTYIASIDEAMNHYDVRGPFARKLAEALARQMDRHLLQQAVIAARTAGVSGMPGGSVVTQSEVGASGIDFAADSEDLIAAIFYAARVMDEKDIPEDGRFAAVNPQTYSLLAQNTKIMNKDWGGAGVYADGKVLRVAGIEIIKTNNLPSGVVANGTVAAGTDNKYAGDFTDTVALVAHQEAVGTVKLMDLGMESEWDARRRATLMLAEYAVGHGVLRPDCAVEIRNVA